MFKRIVLSIPYDSYVTDLNITLKELLYYDSGAIRLNPKQAHIVAIRPDIFRGRIDVLLEHPEFPEHYEGEEYLRYFPEAMARIFPYIFFDTNPLLYRKFR